MAKKIAKNIKFEEALVELEEQVRLLESGELSLEQSLDSLCCLNLIDYFLFHVGEIFNYNLFKIFLIHPFFFSSSSGTPII